MKIGVIFCIYNCEEYVDRCVSSWFDLRSKIDFIFTVTSGRFIDYATLGIPDNNLQTKRKLAEWDFDYCSITGGEKLLDEDSSRNRCLEFLKPHHCDLIWLVDGDEFYTESDIISILDFVNKHEEIEAFSVNFKNYSIEYPLFLNYTRPTLYRNSMYGGIGRFFFDCFYSCSDGVHSIHDLPSIAIPPYIAWVEHYTWLPNISTFDKIKYQELRYCGPNGDRPVETRCSFCWQDDEKKLRLNKKHYDFWSIEVPVLRRSGELYSHDFKLDFNRSQNIINIQNLTASEEHVFSVYSTEGSFYGNYIIYLSPGLNYWINPNPNIHFEDLEDFLGFCVKCYFKEVLIHEEFLYLKTP